MNTPVTFNDILAVIVLLWAVWMLVRFFLWSIVRVIEYFQDRKVNTPEKDAGEPRAGKTLGL